MVSAQNQTKFHDDLRGYIDSYVHKIYDLSQSFPSDEKWGVTSQLRRSSLSVALNYIEGYARIRKPVLKNFIETAYGSLKESEYLLEFCYTRSFIKNKEVFDEVKHLNETIAKMLWGIIKKL